jgi:hypothetical protein
MTTLRAFSSSASAGIARSVLRDHNILCELADVDSHFYSGAMLAIPVRLLVPEEDIEEARRILDSTDLSLPPDFDPTKIEE